MSRKTKRDFTVEQAAVMLNERLISRMTIRQLAEKYDCNRPSIKKAFKLLEHEDK